MKPYKGLTASILLILMVACSGAKLDTDTLVTRALHSLEQGYNSAAITDLKTALQQNPDHGIARKSLGIAYLNDNNGYSAAKELTHALNHIQDDAEIYVLLAKALMLSGQDERLLSISLNNYLSVEDKALVQTYQGVALTKTDTQAARVLLQRAEILSNRFSETALGMAMLQVMQKDYKGAKEWLEEAFNRSGDLYRVWKFLGYVENLEGNFKKSEEAYSQAIKLDASPDSSYMHRSLVRVYLGNMVGAREDLAKLTGEWKTHPQAVFNYGMIYYSEKTTTPLLITLNVYWQFIKIICRLCFMPVQVTIYWGIEKVQKII